MLGARSMRFHVVFEGDATGTADELERALDEAMAALIRHGAEDPGIGGTLAGGEVEISLVVDAADVDAAVETALRAIRQAVASTRIDWRTARATRIDEATQAAG